MYEERVANHKSAVQKLEEIKLRNAGNQTAKNGTIDSIVHAKNEFVYLDHETKYFFDFQVFLEMPFFSLKKETLHADKTWHRENNTAILIRHKNEVEAPTIKDKTTFIFVLSQILHHLNYNRAAPTPTNIAIPTVRYFQATNSAKSGRDYLRLKKSLERLCAAEFTLCFNQNGNTRSVTFKIFENGHISEKEIKVSISKWTKHTITNKEVLKLDNNYIYTRGAITRRIYEICRKHCGKKNRFSIRTEVLLRRIGSTSKSLRFIYQEIKKFNETELGYVIKPERNGFLSITPKQLTP